MPQERIIPAPVADPAADAASGPPSPLLGADAARVPMPPGAMGGLMPLPPPFLPPLVPAQAGQPVMGVGVPAQAQAPAPPSGRSINIADFVDRVIDLQARLSRLEENQIKFFADCRARLDREIQATKAASNKMADVVAEAADRRAAAVGKKIDERYAGKFARMDEALVVIADGCKNMNEAHGLIEAVAKEASRAALQAQTMAAKVDILAETVNQNKKALNARVDEGRAGIKASVDKALADADAAAKVANRATTDVQLVGGRVAKLERLGERLGRAGEGR